MTQTADPSSKTKKGSLSLARVLGFSDELQKISTLVRPTSFGDVRKEVSYAGTALARRKPNYAKVNKGPAPASASDLAESPKTIQPPPVTVPTGNL